MGVFRQFPYSNFHDMNMDEIIKIVKSMLEEWEEYNSKWGVLYNDITTAFNAFKAEFDDFIASINVDVEFDQALNRLIQSGEFARTVDPIISNYTSDWLAEHISATEGKTVIDDSLTISGAGADAKVVGDKFRKMSLRDILSGIYNIVTSFNRTDNYAWDITTSPIAGDAYYYVRYTVSGMKKVMVSGRSWGSRYPLIAFYDANNILLTSFGSVSQEYTDVIVDVPDTASYCYINGATHSTNTVKLYALAETTAFDVTLKGMPEIVDACNNDNILPNADNANVNTAYRLYFSGYLSEIKTLNLPITKTTSVMGLLITLGKEQTNTGFREQICITETDGIFFRWASSNGYNSWKTLTPRKIEIRYDEDVIGKFIEASTDPNIKDIYIHAGTYDVIALYEQHYGSDFFNNYTGYSSGDNNFGRGIVLKSGKRYHFSTGAIFTANYTGSNSAVTSFFSMFAPEYGYELEINGLTITECNNLRYAIHTDFELGTNTTGGTLEFINCNIQCNNRPIGAGLSNHSRLKLTNSVFICNSDTVDVHVHTPNAQGDKGELIATGCYFNTRLQLGQGSSNTAHSRAYLNNNSWHLLVNEPPQVFDILQFNNVTH